jgi:TP901 family phage tail tape measure protein
MALANINLKFGVNLKDFSSRLETIQKSVNKTAASMEKVGKSMSLYVTAPLAAIGGIATKINMDFDDSMRKVMATTNSTMEEFNKLKITAQQMGAQTRYSASESAEAMNYMALAGWKTEQIISGIPAVLNLAAASGENLARVSDIVTDGLTAFGKSADYSNRFTDILAATAANANTNIAMLGDGFKYVAPLAGSLGFAVEDTALALGLMANAGIKGSQGGTALRSLLTRLVKPTAESARAMNDLGISVSNADGTMKPLSDIMTELRGKLAQLPPAQQAMYSGMLAGQEALSGLLAIVNTSEEDFTKLGTSLENSGGTAQRMAEQMEGGLGGAMRSLASITESLMIQIGEILTPAMSAIVSVAQSVVTWFTSLSTTTKTVMVVIGALAAAVGPVLVGIGFLGTTILPMVTAGMATLGTVTLATLGPIAAIGAAVVGLGILIYKNWDSIVSYFKGPEMTGLFSEVKNSISAIGEYIKTFYEGYIKPFLITGMEVVKAFWNTMFPILSGYFMNFVNNVVSGLKAFFGVVTGVFKTLKGIITFDWEQTWDGVKKIFTSLWDGIVEILQSNISLISGLLAKLLDKIGLDGWATQLQVFSDSMKVNEKTFTETVNTIVEDAAIAIPAIQAITETVEGLGDAISGIGRVSIGSIEGNGDKASLLPDLDTGAFKEKLDSIKLATVSTLVYINEQLIAFNENANAIIIDSIGGTFSGLGEAIGGALAVGGNILQSSGAALLSGIADMLGQLGQLAISAGIAVAGIKAALKSLNPVVAIAAGVALVALSSVIKGRVSSLGGGKSSSGGGELGGAVGISGARAMGGTVMANRSYLVGERGPEIFTPSGHGGITPNKQVGNGPIEIHITGELTGRGGDLKAVIDRYVTVNGRTT